MVKALENKNQIDMKTIQLERKMSEVESVTDSHMKLEYRGEFFGETPWYLGIGPWSAEVSEEDLPRSLASLEAAAMVCVIDDAIDELNILKYVIGAPVLDPMEMNFKSLAARYTRRLTPVRVFPEVEVRPILTSAIKLQRDRELIELIFNRTSKSLAEERNYIPLFLALEELRREFQEDENLIQQLKENIVYLRELKIKVEEKKKMDDAEEKERDELMYCLQDEMDDVKLKCQIEENFVSKWENVRNAQHKWKLRLAENFYKDNTVKFLTKMKLEKRVSYEMQLFLKICQAELEEKLEEWMALYDSEMERRENKILHLKYSRDQAEEKKEQLHKLYKERTEEMKNWITFREIRKKRSAASLIIQSWWRGIMVRKKLGPYKQKKVKTKEAKGKKKK